MPLFDDNYEPYKTKTPLDKTKLPEPVYEDEPLLIDLYYLFFRELVYFIERGLS